MKHIVKRSDFMYGAILGDIIGSPYEFDQGEKTKDFPLFSKDSTFTDDSVMTLAVAEALMNTVEACGRHFARTGGTGLTDEVVKENVVYAMQKYGARYPDAGMAPGFHSGCGRKIHGPTAVLAMVRPCGYLRQHGCLMRWMRCVVQLL